MLQYLSSWIPKPSKEGEEEDHKDESNSEVTSLNRAMKVHTSLPAKIYFTENLKASREDIGGVPECFLLHNVLTPKECSQFIEITEKLEYTDAPISTGVNKAVMMKDTRDNLRVMLEATPDILQSIWERIAELIPESLVIGADKTWRIAHDQPLNERFRFYRYDAEQSFKPHFDGCFPRSRNTEQSHFTFIIYLNDGFEGGETTFFPGGINSLWTRRITHKEVRINPQTGTAVLFRHTGVNSPLHEGSPHYSKGSCKYVLRTDIMYRLERDPAKEPK